VKNNVYPGELNGINLNLVNYSNVKVDPNFTTFINYLATANTSSLTRNETYAFYINVYNALAMNMIITHSCETDIFGDCGKLVSIHDIDRKLGLIYGGVWTKQAGVVAKKTVSLDDIENLLRNPPNGYREDPRLHACIVCASVSCPDVRSEAYVPQSIGEQMLDNFRKFISNPKKGMNIDTSSSTVTLSEIFDWYEDDFTTYTATNNVLDFILLYMDPNDVNFNWLSKNKDKVTINHFHYDWNVNAEDQWIPCSAKARPCYQVWALLVTLAVIVVLALFACCCFCCIKRRKHRHHPPYERVHS